MRVEPFTEKYYFFCFRFTDEIQQAMRSSPSGEPTMCNLWQTKTRIIRRYSQITRQCDFESTPDCIAVNCRYYRCGQACKPTEDAVSINDPFPNVSGIKGRDMFQVSSNTECAFAAASQDNDAYQFVSV